jgi:glycosyltransferase involved in cell wall biosynthesis
MAADLQEYVGLTPDKIAVIHNPVDVDEVRRRSRGEKSAQTAVGGEGADEPGAVHGGGAAGLPVRPEAGGTRLLAAGRLDRQKGFDILLQTLAALPPEYLLTIAGDGEQREELEAQAAGLGIAGRVEFAGFSANPYALMAGADIFVLSSRYEGFPNVVLEALASGTPVAAFGGPCATEEIIEEGVDGALAVPEDPASLADAVLRIAAAPPDSGTIVRRVEERFGIDQVISRYEALFEEVTER